MLDGLGRGDAKEVRVFPLLTMDGQPSPHLAGVVTELRQAGYHVAVDRVAYEVLRGGNQMLRLSRQGLSRASSA